MCWGSSGCGFYRTDTANLRTAGHFQHWINSLHLTGVVLYNCHNLVGRIHSQCCINKKAPFKKRNFCSINTILYIKIYQRDLFIREKKQVPMTEIKTLLWSSQYIFLITAQQQIIWYKMLISRIYKHLPENIWQECFHRNSCSWHTRAIFSSTGNRNVNKSSKIAFKALNQQSNVLCSEWFRIIHRKYRPPLVEWLPAVLEKSFLGARSDVSFDAKSRKSLELVETGVI